SGSAAKKTAKRVSAKTARRRTPGGSNAKSAGGKQGSSASRKAKAAAPVQAEVPQQKSPGRLKSSKPAKSSTKTNGASAKRKAAGAGAPQRASAEVAKKSLKTLVAIVEQANDREAEQILGDGQLEALLKGVLPPRRRSTKTTYDYLASQKRRASLMARLRHGINTAYSFPTGVDGRFISPTRV